MSVFLSGCDTGGNLPVDTEIAKSSKTRITTLSTDDVDMEALVNGNTAFALDLYRNLSRKQNGNLLCSPYSISVALAMSYAGARNNTETQMANTLYFLPQSGLHPAFNVLDLELSDRNSGDSDKDMSFILSIVNAPWGQKDYNFLDDFLDVLAQYYDAGIRLVDFINNPEGARSTINKWVEEQTHERIKDLIPQGYIDTLTRLVLTNAIYFKAAWGKPFDETKTHTEDFQALSGISVSVEMMAMTSAGSGEKGEKLIGGIGNGFTAAELPYYGGELSMVFVMPDIGTFNEFEQSLNADKIKEITEILTTEVGTFKMPRFSYESQFSLSDTLRELGMTDAFISSLADFSGITGARDLFITEVIHKTFISVDEKGTEAAAATAVLFSFTAIPDYIQEIILNRPFIYFIRDIKSGTILFLGRIVNPVE